VHTGLSRNETFQKRSVSYAENYLKQSSQHNPKGETPNVNENSLSHHQKLMISYHIRKNKRSGRDPFPITQSMMYEQNNSPINVCSYKGGAYKVGDSLSSVKFLKGIYFALLYSLSLIAYCRENNLRVESLKDALRSIRKVRRIAWTNRKSSSKLLIAWQRIAPCFIKEAEAFLNNDTKRDHQQAESAISTRKLESSELIWKPRTLRSALTNKRNLSLALVMSGC
jgi:hypothetical protein